MANLVVTSTADYVKVVFNAESSVVGFSQGYWPRSGLIVTQDQFAGVVRVSTGDASVWVLSYTTTSGAAVVDSVDGVAPASNTDLCDKLGALVKS